MPIYDAGKSDSDGRGMTRALDKLNSQIHALSRVTAAGDIPDPTPPPDEVAPGVFSRLLIYGSAI